MTVTTHPPYRSDVPLDARPDSTLVLAAAIDRLAQALEQLVLTRFDEQNAPPLPSELPPPVEIAADSYPTTNTGTWTPPPGTTITAAPLAQCPVHHQDWKYVPAGVSKKNGRPYDSFYACPVTGCTQRPPTR